MGAMGKSAQFLLHTWLPDAMEGPTPVSALIHAATMVTAGVFMVARLSPLFELSHTCADRRDAASAPSPPSSPRPSASCRTTSSASSPIRPARSSATCSWRSASAPIGAAIFHLFTHAFFKALLFLGSGSVIHAMLHEQDMRKMGGLRKHDPDHLLDDADRHAGADRRRHPGTVIGYCRLLLQGRHHRGRLRRRTTPSPTTPSVLLVIAACFTSFYSWRLIFMTFHGKPRASHDVMHHVHESPPVMLVPLFILAAGALFAGVVFHDYFIGEGYEEFWKAALFTRPGQPHPARHARRAAAGSKLAPFVAMLVGFVRRLPVLHPRAGSCRSDSPHGIRPLYQFLLNKWYFDELYDFLFVRPAKWLGRFLWKSGDGWLIDGFGPDGVSARVIDVTNRVVKLQTGYLYHYAFAMLIGVAALVTWMMFGSTF